MRVTSDALRQIRGGHPWVFEQSVTSVSHEPTAGDLAVVFDRRRRFAAIGLWDPTSPIRIRILHAGRPEPIDETFWHDRVTAALDRRRELASTPGTTAYRLVHGENDGLGGLVVDRYADVIVVKVYSPSWLAHLRDLLPLVRELTDPVALVLRLARHVSRGETHGCVDGMVVGGVLREPVMFVENGLRFEAFPTTGQKTGHFLDQRENRARVRELATGRSVLDVFSCSGGFGVHAAAGGARSVHFVDRSPHAVDAAKRNLTHNDDLSPVRSCPVEASVGDAFEVMVSLARGQRRFDLVVVDPPSFASRRSTVAGALRAYQRLTRLALDLLAPGGVLVQASCSSQVRTSDFVRNVADAAAACGSPIAIHAQTGHPVDHPVSFPQGEYLKAVFASRAEDRR